MPGPKDVVFGFYEDDGSGRFKLWNKARTQYMSHLIARIEKKEEHRPGVTKLTLDADGDYTKDLSFGSD
ncbi:MAG TPA: hypothetical protein VFQ21_03590 [Gemmatimonadota bacterium]|nr:hypothetical protein [Gemmatimonadota bacterium]